MGYTYTTVNGQRVNVAVANAFAGMAAEFKRVFGLDLIVSSGTRTREEQARLYDGWVRRLPGFNLAAPPGQSNHEEGGPIGPRALDLRDSGGDPGVTRVGTKRSNWLAANCHRWGFKAAGHSFKPVEGWHYEYTGALSTEAPAPAPAPAPAVTDAGGTEPAGDPGGYNPFGIRWSKGLQKVARLYGYRGAIDGQFGPGSKAGFAQFLRVNWGYVGDNELGPVMWAAIARWLRARWGYVGDNIPGPVMRAALLRAEAANYKEL